MKKIIFFAALGFCLHTTATHAQSNVLSKAKGVATAAGFDVGSLTSGIMSKLTPSLALTSKQTPGVTNAVSGFLTQKAGIMSLQQSNPTAYKTKAASLVGGLKSKLGTILTAAQMAKFVGLKPKTNDVTNVLSQLFF